MKKIIALTGSFNPVTVAHYKIISDAVEKFNADEGVFIAVDDRYLSRKALIKTNPPSNFILPEKFRGEMINSLSEDNPKLSYWGVELGGATPSTYKTLAKLMKDKQKEYPREEIKLYFLFGADKLKQMPRWDRVEELSDLCEFLVYARHFDIESVIASDPFLTSRKDRIHLLQVENADIEDVSSTELRRRFFAGEDYSSLMNKGPYRIMQEKCSPSCFKPLTDEDIIKAHILYDGRFGGNAARLKIFKSNAKIFKLWPSYLGDRDAHRLAKTYTKEFSVSVPELSSETVTDCVNTDCADVAKSLLDEGLNPAILNLASRISPCGGYHKGTSAQEECLSQMSTLSQSLYQFGSPKYKHIRESGLNLVPDVYPLDINFGGVYSHCVTFFRHNIDAYYALRDKTFDCPIVTVASLSNREKNEFANDEKCYFDDNGYLTDEGKKIETNKIRTIFRIALENGHDSMVLGAFGCGVFNLHSDEVATIFKNVLNENEFKNRFKKLVFAIYEGKPSPCRREPIGCEGKFAPFYKIFAKN
ncbi:MAG: TIGR02452 family protein [Clostridia bacterium]|nr:TIGR02452 family protein [Clostridia bacterium]